MAKQLNVNLAFTADTSKAAAQMQSLQNQLSQIAAAPAKSLNVPWTKELQEASAAAIELKVHLQNATNVKTGSLDFTKLNASIQKSGKTLAEYGRQLQALGPQGQQAFMSLANAVVQAEIPIKRSNALLKEMMTTLKNTARWQLSSSILHGFMGAIQSAYGYAQDLNASLNDIRIVTGQNIEQMAQFAEQANKAAKALSTTTTGYTNASLIYYQQGLSDTEVAKRTEVTVKMANAAGQSAEIVSDQLTAVWNNFYNGSKSLEYYADVMTALGAATASSTEEIAGGLEKFAAIADTIGLSYEYAAAALATITSNTRQSEEVVGTALKTIFARIQGLNLGETLDDGVTLNKYSEALQKVGINIIDASGKMKDMDLILDEMANKWDNLSKAQQVALAQTVAGTRQYNQLIALMDNWNAGDADSMTSNLKTAYNATGTLQKQADIYAESWEAAQNRVRAAAEDVYSSLLDEDFFIGILNGLEKVLNYVDSVVDSLGGLKGALTTVGVIMTKVFSTQMAEGLRNMAHNIYMSTEGGRQAVKQQKFAELDEIQYQMEIGYEGIGSDSGTVASKQYSEQIDLQKQLIENSERMSESEIAHAQQLLDLRRQIGDQVIKAAEIVEQTKDKLYDSKQMAFAQMGQKSAADGLEIIPPQSIRNFEVLLNNMKKISNEAIDLKDKFKAWNMAVDTGNGATEMMELRDAVTAVGEELSLSDEIIDDYMRSISDGGEIAKQKIEELLNLLAGKQGRNQASMIDLGVDKRTVQEIVSNYNTIAEAAKKKAEAEKRAADIQEQAKKKMIEAKGAMKDWADGLVSGAQAVMSFASIINMASSAIDTLTNPDMSGWEKFLSILQSGAMIITMTVSLFNSLSQAQQNWSKGTLKNAAATMIEAAATALSTKANEKNAQAQHKKAAGHNADSKAAGKDAAMTAIEGKVTETNGNKQISINKNLSSSFKDLGTSIKSYVKAYSSQIGGIALIAAAVAVAVGTISWVINQYNAAEQAAEDAAKAAEQLSNQYQEVKSNYEAFGNTVDSYKNAIDSMKSLTKGTVEYNEALMQANEHAMELIDKYNLIGQYSIQNGLIVIDEGALEATRKQQLDLLGKAQAAQYMGQVAAGHFAGEANKNNLNRKINSQSDNWQNIGNTAAAGASGAVVGGLAAVGGSMLAGAGAGSAAGPIGLIAGAVIGLIAGTVTTIITGAESAAEEAALNNISQYVSQNGDGLFAAQSWEEFDRMLSEAELEIEDKDLVKSLYANRDAVKELTSVEVARLQKEDANWEAGFVSYNMGNEQYANLSVGQGYLTEQASNYRAKNIDRVRNEVDELWSWSNDDFWAKYLQYIYNQENIDVDNTSGENVRIRDLGGGAVTVEKMNEDGIWETYGDKNGLDEEAAAEQLVNAILLQEASAKMDFEALNSLVAELKNAGLTVEKDSALMDSILSSFGDTGNISLNGFAVSDVFNIDTSNIDNAQLKEALDAAIQSYKEGMTEVQKEVVNSDWYKNLTPEEQDLVWTLNISGYDSEADVEQLITQVQSALDAATFSLKIDSIQNLEKLIKNTNKDWDAIFEEYAKLLNNDTNQDGKVDANDLSFDDKKLLTTSTDEELLRLFTKQQDAIMTDWSQSIPDNIAEQEAGLKNAQEQAATNEQRRADYDELSKAEKVDYVHAQGKISDADYAAWNYFNPDGNLYDEEGIYTLFEELQKGNFKGKQFTEDQSRFIEAFLKGYNSEDKWSTLENFAAISDLQHYDSETFDLFYQSLGLDPNSVDNETLSDYLKYGDVETAFVNALMEGMFNSGTNLFADIAIDRYGDSLPTAEDVNITERENDLIEAYQNKRAWYDQFEEQNQALGLDNKAIDNYATSLIELSEAGEIVNSTLKDNEYIVLKLAQQNSLANKGVVALSKDFEGLYSVLTSGKETTVEFNNAVGDLDTLLSQALTINIGTLSKEFLTSENNLSLMQQAVEGNIEAFEQLRILAAQDIIESAGVGRPLQTYFTGLINKLSQQEISIGTSIDQNKFAKDLLIATQAAGMTTSDIQSMFDALGWETTLSSGKIDLGTSVYRGSASQILTTPEQEAKKSKKLDSIKKEDMIDRYKELNDSLETVADAMSDAEKAADRLYGKDRLKQMEKVNYTLLQEIELQKKKRKEAEKNLEIDKDSLAKAAEAIDAAFGYTGEQAINLEFNADGSIKGIETIMSMVIAAYNAKAEELKDSMNEADQALLENMKATIEAFKDAIGQYDDTRAIIREAENARQDAFNRWQDNNYEQLSYKLEIDLEINEAELRDLEYRINKLGDTAAEMAEAIGLIYSSTGGSQYDFYNEAMERYASQKDTLDAAYRSGQISQADYIEGLQEVSDGIYENLEALADLDKMMMEYYGNTLAAANEELDKFIERISHSAGILEHYSSIMDLLGKSSNYKTMGVILEGQADVAENQAKSSKAIMEMMQGEAEDRYRAYQKALASGDKAAAELYLKQYEEALAAAQEAEDEYLSNAEQWAESLKAILENKLADLGKTLEEALTGGTSFEQLTTQMERAASLQEEYLTSTNQIYETTKMMRAAQQEIDKTTNTVAKNKIANFIAETKQLQNQSKLSQYELDVQQAKYDLLLAEIALQEAQNAKSTVRLQRDAEGNFGYIYTADSSAIADATQKYEDAQNALYNIGLEGANDYGQKYQQTMNEMYDSLTELQNQYLSGAFESESAYNLAVEEAKRYYYAKLEQYSSLYATATMTDSRVVAEAWFNDFSEMMTTSETWKLAVEEHVANVSSAFGEWQSQVETIASDAGIGGDLESLKLKVNGIVLETSSLTTELTKQGGTIDSLQGSLDTVKKNTDAYAELRKQLEATAERYRQLAKDASAAAAAQNIIDNSAGEVEDLSIQADEYAKKLEETLAEMYEKLKEVKEKRLNEEITQEEYEAQVEAIKRDYYEKLEQYSKEYREILAKDNDLVAEDWFLTLEEMIKDEETFNQAVQEKLKEIEDYFKELAEKLTESGGEMEEEFKELTADIDETEKATGLLNKGIKGPNGLIEAFRGQMVQIDESINAYGSLYSRLEYAAAAYRELAAAARDAARAQSLTSGGGGGSSYSGINMNTPSSEFSYAHFDTGGYTGQWGSYGKLAMLHEKELVLNKQDTENFLASMGILNNILQTIDLQSANAQIGGILTTPNFHGGGNDMLEQNVHIEASFPNVQNSNDIEEAFNNLINRASQYANRK